MPTTPPDAETAALIAELRRDMGSVVSVIRRKLDVSHDERSQIVMVEKWIGRLDAIEAALQADRSRLEEWRGQWVGLNRCRRYAPSDERSCRSESPMMRCLACANIDLFDKMAAVLDRSRLGGAPPAETEQKAEDLARPPSVVVEQQATACHGGDSATPSLTREEWLTVRRCVADYAGNENWARLTKWIEEARAVLLKIEVALSAGLPEAREARSGVAVPTVSDGETMNHSSD